MSPLEYLGSSLICRISATSCRVRDTAENDYERSAKASKTKMFSLAGLELLLVAPEWLHLLVIGAVGGVAIGWLLVALEKTVRKSKYKQNHEQVNFKGKNMSLSVAAGRSRPVVVDLENCYISDSSELEKHDFKAELAASKFISVAKVEDNLQVVHNKLKEASALFAQAKTEIQARAKSLNSLEVNDDNFIYFIIEFCNAYGLTVDGYSVLLEIVERFWDYCPINIRKYFKIKAQEILDIGYEKPLLGSKGRQALQDGRVDKFNVTLVSDGNGEELSSLTLSFSPESSIQASILESFDSYSKYIDIALRFARSVFDAAVEDKNREDIGGVSEIDYCLSLPEEKILQRLNDLETSNTEDWTVSVEPGEIDMKKIEEINEVLGRYGQRIEVPKISDRDSPES